MLRRTDQGVRPEPGSGAVSPTAAASVTQLFAFHTIRNQVFHTTPLFFVAGVVVGLQQRIAEYR